MRLKASDIREPLLIEVRGDEAWLDLIYDSFRLKPGEQVTRRLTGSVTVALSEYDVFTVKGHLAYAPLVPCGRCEDPIEWPIARDIDVRFITPVKAEDLDFDADEDGEVDLEPTDLDSYYVEENVIDLEQVFNDLVQTALPQRLVKTTPDGKACSVCLADLQEMLVYEDKNAKDTNPFAVLKNLKLPQD